jgi:hypothetical protein
MIKSITRLLLLTVIILFTNRFEHDYAVLASSFHRGEAKFSLVTYAFQYVREFVDYDYSIVHLFYVLLFSWSLVTKFRPGLVMIVITIVPIGYILNEQMRFFSGLAFGLVNPIYSLIAFVIHPGASAISAIFWLSKIVFRLGEGMRISGRSLVFLIGLFALSPFLKMLAIKAASVLGYGYVGSVFFDSSSLEMKLFKVALLIIVMPLMRYLNSVVFFMFAISLAFDSLAIVSGRTIIMFFILALLNKRYFRKDFVLNPFLLSKALFFCILVVSLYVRFFNVANFG